MNKFNNQIEDFYETKKGLYVFSTVIPLLTMMLVWILIGVFPFGDETLMSIDFGQQYISLYQFFKRTLLTGDWSGLFYSFSKSIGGAMIGIWGFNLISPFNLIYALLPTEEFRWGITLTIWLRYGATALAFSYLLIKRYNGHTNERRFLVPLLSAVYAMSGLIVSYQMNPIFYDAMIMLPIVIVFLEELLDGGPGWKYALAISLTLAFHFYMGYMICLFVAMYTIFYMVGHSDDWRKAWQPILKALIYSLVGVGMVLWLLYPIFLNLLISKGAYESSLVFDWKMQINPIDILAKFMVGAFDSQSWPAGPNLPNVFIGGFALFGFGLFFANKKIKTKEKIAALVIMSVFFFAIVNVFFNKIWHMGQTPAGFFYRFSWIISFFMVLLSYRGLHDWHDFNWRYTAIGAAFIYLTAEWVFTKDFSFFTFSATNEIVPILENYLALILRVLIILFIFSLYKYKNLSKEKLFTIIGGSILLFIVISVLNHFHLLVKLQTLSLAIWIFVLIVISLGFKRSTYLAITMLTIFELGMNAFIAQSRMNYDDASKFKDAQVSVLEPINQIRPSKDGEFYRINKTFERSKNDPFMYDYPGLTHFSSNMERSTLNFMTSVGDSGSNASSYYGNGTVFMDAFYGIRYVVDYKNYTNEDTIKYPERRYFSRNTTRTDLMDYYSQIWENDRYMIYENQNVLPIAFGVNDATVNLELANNQVVTTHNNILSAISGQDLQVYKSYLFEDIELTNVETYENSSGKTIYKKTDTSKSGVIKFSFTPQTDATYYINAPLALKRQKGGATEIQMNGRWYDYQHSFDGQQLWNVANKSSGQKIEFTLTMGTTTELDLTDMYLITADQSISEEIVLDRMKQGIKVSEWGNNFVKGEVEITDDSTHMMTSIPFNKGWTILVDGQPVEIKETWGAFISFPITAGKHSIEMKFIPDGWYEGLIVSGLSLIALIGYTLLEKSKRKTVVNE